MSRKLGFGAAINEAIHIAMQTDPTVLLMGEDVAGGGDREGVVFRECLCASVSSSVRMRLTRSETRNFKIQVFCNGFQGFSIVAVDQAERHEYLRFHKVF